MEEKEKTTQIKSMYINLIHVILHACVHTRVHNEIWDKKRSIYIPYKIFRDIHDTLSFLKRKQSQPYVQYNFISEKKTIKSSYIIFICIHMKQESLFTVIYSRGVRLKET